MLDDGRENVTVNPTHLQSCWFPALTSSRPEVEEFHLFLTAMECMKCAHMGLWI